GTIGVTLSIGVATAHPEHLTFDSLFETADRAWYEAKRRGRDGVVTAFDISEGSRELSANLKQFVGREAELARLTRLLDASTASGPTVVAVIGEAGIGKSTLVRQLAAEVRLRA